MNVKKDILIRVRVAFFFVALLAVMIVVWVFRLQFLEGQHWKKLAQELSTEYQTIQAVRGNIYSDDGSLLATSVPTYEIRMDMMASGLTKDVFNDGVDSVALLLSRMFNDKPKDEYLRILRTARAKKQRYFLVKKRVNYNQLKEMRAWPLFRLGKYKGGLIAEEKERRFKPFQHLAERTIGYVSEGQDIVGLEGAFDPVLSGVTGKRLMQKVAGGIWVPVNYDNEIEPEDGKDIYTTIDINLQDVAEDALEKTLVQNNAQNGTVILMEVKTGEIKAIANLSRVSEGIYKEDYNYAIGESAEPGSTFKLLSLMALLESGAASLDDTVEIDNGYTRFFDRDMKDSEPSSKKNVTLKEAFEKSSNVGISKLVYKHFSHSPEKYVSLIRKFGAGDSLGFQIPGEGRPRIKSPKDRDWYGTTLPWMSIGYESRLTPLQMLSIYNAVANDGQMVKPFIVKEIKKAGKTEQKFGQAVINEKICSEGTLKEVRSALEGVVLNGTAKGIKPDAYTIAGKTGTARIARNGSYDKIYKASFAGYFPAEQPVYSCIVVVNGPSNGVYYGGAVAGPVFREIADKVFASRTELYKTYFTAEGEKEEVPSVKISTKKDIKTVLDKIAVSSHTVSEETADEDIMAGIRETKSVKLVKKSISEGLVPDVAGMNIKDAVFLLESKGLRVRYGGAGRVRSQSLTAGGRIIRGSTIYLELG